MLAALAFAACSNTPGGSIAQNCTATLSGGLTGGLDNCSAITSADSGTMTWTINIGGTPTGGVKTLSNASATLKGAPQAGHFPSLNPDLSPGNYTAADFELTASDGTRWSACWCPPQDAGATSATFDLNLTAVIRLGGTYTLTGEFDVELVAANPPQPAPQPATLKVTF
jgi:hypothetical protein